MCGKGGEEEVIGGWVTVLKLFSGDVYARVTLCEFGGGRMLLPICNC